MPPSVQELLRHPAHLLDLSAIFAAYDEERGYRPYHPTMMTALLLVRGEWRPVAIAHDLRELLAAAA